MLVLFECKIALTSTGTSEHVLNRLLKRRHDIIFDSGEARLVQLLPALDKLRSGSGGVWPVLATETKGASLGSGQAIILKYLN